MYKAIVICQSVDEERTLLHLWEDKGYRWADGKKPTYYRYYELSEARCYWLDEYGYITKGRRTIIPEDGDSKFKGYCSEYLGISDVSVDVTEYL